ncbi:hypothetical protein [Pseudomonas sp. P9(2020)]|uniref:hypothetical protein n=1 Tax=Pseudomonas sp. P9(2020) TaxID=2763316 RepID=UPI001B3264F2|nr:hypothetical protein [Pseudomonas sp. P9(2020)]MBP5947967.1 hypothetical protein [Pseudomonas sp. P9(2020)]
MDISNSALASHNLLWRLYGLAKNAGQTSLAHEVANLIGTPAPQDTPSEAFTVEGVVRFSRSDDVASQACSCCPAGTGHVFARGVLWDQYETNHPEHFGNGPEVFIARHITNKNRNEGRRVRLTVEILPDDANEEVAQ